MNLHEWWLRLGDRNTVTIWSWIITLPFAVTVMTNYYLCDEPRDVALMSVGAFVTHCAVGRLLLIARTLLRASPTPWCALVLFALIGAARPFVLDATTAALDLPVDSRPILVRVALNTMCSVVLLSLVAILVGALRVRIELQRSLRAARKAVALQQARDRYRLDQIRLHRRRYSRHLTGCAISDVTSPRIVGGTPRSMHRFPPHPSVHTRPADRPITNRSAIATLPQQNHITDPTPTRVSGLNDTYRTKCYLVHELPGPKRFGPGTGAGPAGRPQSQPARPLHLLRQTTRCDGHNPAK